mmetsp:Transcript_2033/g.1763  ORF Transcript_2033/g.1763 Transcript_2033/m.1763 type:complete len:98 (-) Transcript_2033:113-406(-)
MLACWGNNGFGQTTVPKEWRGAYSVSANFHTCALRHGQVGCWGINTDGQLDVPRGGKEGNVMDQRSVRGTGDRGDTNGKGAAEGERKGDIVKVSAGL